MIPDEDLPDFERFDHDDAWRIGAALVERCRADRLPIVISITLGEQRVFHAALPGATADNDAWAERKARVVRRFDHSSRAVGQHYGVDADPSGWARFGLPAADFAPAEGAIPIRVRGTQVGVLAISGLEEGGDHDIALEGLRADR